MTKNKLYLRYSRYKAEILLRQQKMTNLLPSTVKELHAEGYSYNQMVVLLGVGKNTLVKIMHGYKPKSRHEVRP